VPPKTTYPDEEYFLSGMPLIIVPEGFTLRRGHVDDHRFDSWLLVRLIRAGALHSNTCRPSVIAPNEMMC